jgi:uncharacterized membrane protein
MSTRASIRKHPIHPMLVAFPLALWVTAVVFDVVAIVTGNATARAVAFYDIGAGIIGALASAIPGFIDYLTLEGAAARRTGTWHMVLNLAALALFTASWLARTRWGAGIVGANSWLPQLTAFIGLAVLAPAGWLGGALVFEHGMGVEPVNSRPPARGRRRAA